MQHSNKLMAMITCTAVLDYVPAPVLAAKRSQTNMRCCCISDAAGMLQLQLATKLLVAQLHSDE
jgi:hypothetical protein